MAAKNSSRRRGGHRPGSLRPLHTWLIGGVLTAAALAAGAIIYRSAISAGATRAPSAVRASAKVSGSPGVGTAEASSGRPDPAKEQQAANPIQPAAAKMSPSQWQSLDEAFVRQLRRCWTPPSETEARPFVAKIRVEFSPDGSLRGKPALINPPSDPASKAQAAVAMKAVTDCKQLNIPASFGPFYAEWRTRIINFDPTI